MRVPGKPPAGGLVKVVGILALCVVCTFPVYWMFVTATLPTAELFNRTPELFPHLGNLSVFVEVLSDTPMLTWLVNSTVVAIGTTVASIFFASRAIDFSFSIVALRSGGDVSGFSFCVVGVVSYSTTRAPWA